MVRMHRDLLLPGEDCIGGGYYEIDYTGARLLLSGRSYDYGRPRWAWLDRLRVPKSFCGLRIVYASDGAWEDGLDVGSLIPIEYVD